MLVGMNPLTTLTAIPLLVLLSQFTRAENLVPNGDFSQIKDGRLLAWQTFGGAGVKQRLEASHEDGKTCAKLTCTRCEGGRPDSHAMLAEVGAVPLQKGRFYEFACRVKSEGGSPPVARVAMMDMQDWQTCGLATDFALGSSWRECRHSFLATRSIARTGRLQLSFNQPGILYVADVQIHELEHQRVDYTDVLPDLGSKNLVFNGSFEVGAAGWSTLSQKVGWGCLPSLHGSVIHEGARQGASFLRIPVGGNNTPVVSFDYFEPVSRRELQPLAASLGWIPVELGKPYTVSCEMRSEQDGVPAVLGVRSSEPRGGETDHRKSVRLTRSWQRYSFTFRPARRYVFVTLGPALSDERSTYLDVDAVQLEKGDQATPFEPRSRIEVGIEPSQSAGIIRKGETAAIRLTGCNYGDRQEQVQVSLEATDFFDRAAPLAVGPFAVPAHAASTRNVNLPPDWKGYYRIKASSGSAAVQPDRLSLALVPRIIADDSVLGINHAFATSEQLKLASKAGVTWYRDWSLKWQHIEPQRGQWRWDIADAQLDRVLRDGSHILPLLPPFPAAYWSTEAPATAPARDYPAIRKPMAAAPKEPRDLAEYVNRVVSRYKDRIHVWEFLNEPIFTNYALPRGSGYTPADYVRLLKVAAAGMKRSDPRCKVMGGIAGPPTMLTREVIEAGCLNYLDILNLHQYPGAEPPEAYIQSMKALSDLMAAHGGVKPIWITEFSYYAADDLPCRPFLPGEWFWGKLLDDETQCAAFTVRYFAIMLGSGVQKIFVHSGSTAGPNEVGFECCLFGRQSQPRKVFPALAVLAETLGPNPVPAGSRIIGDSAYCYAFETGKRSVLVCWASSDQGTNGITPASGAKMWDIMGKPISTRPARLTAAPVYLTGQAGEARQMLSSLQ
jgi:hypothetical protein